LTATAFFRILSIFHHLRIISFDVVQVRYRKSVTKQTAIKQCLPIGIYNSDIIVMWAPL
jgi:hypothetical protein